MVSRVIPRKGLGSFKGLKLSGGQYEHTYTTCVKLFNKDGQFLVKFHHFCELLKHLIIVSQVLKIMWDVQLGY